MGAVVVTRFSYPKVPGDQPESIADVVGPASYVVYVSPTAGGQLVTASALGLESFSFVGAMMNNLGTLAVTVVPVILTPPPAPPVNPNVLWGSDFDAVRLIWRLSGTFAEVGVGSNLSAFSVRIFARGH